MVAVASGVPVNRAELLGRLRLVIHPYRIPGFKNQLVVVHSRAPELAGRTVKKPLFPGARLTSEQRRRKINRVIRSVGRQGGACERCDGAHQIDVYPDTVDDGGLDPARPPEDSRHPGGTFPTGSLPVPQGSSGATKIIV